MTKETSDLLEQHLKKTTIRSNVVSLIISLATVLTFGYGFYFNTTSTLSAHTADIQQVKSDVKEIKESLSESQSFEGITKAQQSDMKARIQRIEDKQDQLLQLMLTMDKNIRDK